jgi:hypothetical protein
MLAEGIGDTPPQQMLSEDGAPARTKAAWPA